MCCVECLQAQCPHMQLTPCPFVCICHIFPPDWYRRKKIVAPTFIFYEPCSFSNLSFTSPTSQLILQPFHRFTYVTAHSPTLPLLYPRHSSFSNPSFAFPTLQALHLIHPASRPWFFHARSNQCNLLFIFCFFKEKQLSLTETIKYGINKWAYMFKFIIFKFFVAAK